MDQPRIEHDVLQEFRDSFWGQMVLPSDDDYDDARTVWNGMIDKYLAIIARCTGVADVITAVNFARENDLLVAVRGAAITWPVPPSAMTGSLSTSRR